MEAILNFLWKGFPKQDCKQNLIPEEGIQTLEAEMASKSGKEHLVSWCDEKLADCDCKISHGLQLLKEIDLDLGQQGEIVSRLEEAMDARCYVDLQSGPRGTSGEEWNKRLRRCDRAMKEFEQAALTHRKVLMQRRQVQDEFDQVCSIKEGILTSRRHIKDDMQDLKMGNN